MKINFGLVGLRGPDIREGLHIHIGLHRHSIIEGQRWSEKVIECHRRSWNFMVDLPLTLK